MASEFEKGTGVGVRVSSNGVLGVDFGYVSFESCKGTSVGAKVFNNGEVATSSSLEYGKGSCASAKISSNGVVVANSNGIIRTSVMAFEFGKGGGVCAMVCCNYMLGTSFGFVAFESRKGTKVCIETFGNGVAVASFGSIYSKGIGVGAKVSSNGLMVFDSSFSVAFVSFGS